MEVNDHVHALAALPPGKVVSAHWLGNYMNPRAGLDTLARRKIPRFCRESNPGLPSRSLITLLTELPAAPTMNRSESFATSVVDISLF
jgi:hypothetical protein